MNRRVNVAYYVGDQEPIGQLWNILLPNGIRNNQQGITHVYDSTVTRTTLERLVPGIRFPEKLEKRDIWRPELPIPKNAIAYTIV